GRTGGSEDAESPDYRLCGMTLRIEFDPALVSYVVPAQFFYRTHKSCGAARAGCWYACVFFSTSKFTSVLTVCAQICSAIFTMTSDLFSTGSTKVGREYAEAEKQRNRFPA
ncbi:hypothetical protein B0H11DRAFT_1755023, partial [Mycena galericulata]